MDYPDTFLVVICLMTGNGARSGENNNNSGRETFTDWVDGPTDIAEQSSVHINASFTIRNDMSRAVAVNAESSG